MADYFATLNLQFEDFKFVNFDNCQEHFETNYSHQKIIQTDPDIKIYDNVLYTPSKRVSSDEIYGCLFDEDRNRIESSCLRRGEKTYLTNDSLTSDIPNSLDRGNANYFDHEVFYLGWIINQYGHFLLESLARCWSIVDQIKKAKYYLVHPWNNNCLNPKHVTLFFDLLGIDKNKIIYFEEPTIIKRVIVAQAAFQIRSHVFSRYRNIFRHIVEKLDIKIDLVQQTEQPLYFSRSLLSDKSRKVRGEHKLERILTKHGFQIVHPQFIPIKEQIYLINRHKYIMGCIGSAMHNLLFSLSPKMVTYFTSVYPNGNYLLIDKCLDISSTYVKSLTVDKKCNKSGFQKNNVLNFDLIIEHLKNNNFIS